MDDIQNFSRADLPVLPLRDMVVFPNMLLPLFVGREKSVEAISQAQNHQKEMVLLTQKDAENDNPVQEDLHTTGTLVKILQMIRLSDGTVKVLVEGVRRVRLLEWVSDTPHFKGIFEDIPQKLDPKKEESYQALVRTVKEDFSTYAKMEKKISKDVILTIRQLQDSLMLPDMVTVHLDISVNEKQNILAETDPYTRLENVFELMQKEIVVLQEEQKIRKKVREQMEKSQREYYLNEQIKVIQKELGNHDEKNEADVLLKKIKKAKMPKNVEKTALAELKKLRQMMPMSAEATVSRNYLDWLLFLPWHQTSEITKDLHKATEILDDGHYGLEKVKEHILEYLAVHIRQKENSEKQKEGKRKTKGTTLKPKQNQPAILCLVGPPGVGKTSLGRSIAEATGREFVRISLGGVRDESEIRGHRRTYIGAMPGKIIHAMKKVKAVNPLILLDEVDKMSADLRGDPSSALLEVLDPEQNNTFVDHYIEVPYDLSKVLFICTANSLNIPLPLQDRMEIIRLSGYTENEKLEIAKRHLVQKQKESAGLKEKEWAIEDSAIMDIIRYYTREAGIRNLEREIARLCRKTVLKILKKEEVDSLITSKNLKKFAGVRKFSYGMAEEKNQVGTVTGLAWTEVGGDLLSIEAVVTPGKGNIQYTGKLGDVMQESIRAARSYVYSRCFDFGIRPTTFVRRDIHVHVPEGATPKDGPSAGVAMATAMVSALTKIPIRKDVAMTGEITLRGHVLPIGGLKEKLLAALRGGIKTVLIPKKNEKDLEEIPDIIKKGLKLIPISSLDEALEITLQDSFTPIKWVEDEYEDAANFLGAPQQKPTNPQATH